MSHQKKRLVVLIAVIALSSCRTEFPSPADMIAQAYAIDNQIVQSYNSGESGDLAGFMRNFWASPELVVIDVSKTLLGFEAWKEEMFGQLQNRGKKKFLYTQSRNTVQGSYVIGSGKWQVTIPDQDGKVQTYDGLYSDVKAIRNGRLVVILSHYSLICSAKDS